MTITSYGRAPLTRHAELTNARRDHTRELRSRRHARVGARGQTGASSPSKHIDGGFEGGRFTAMVVVMCPASPNFLAATARPRTPCAPPFIALCRLQHNGLAPRQQNEPTLSTPSPGIHAHEGTFVCAQSVGLLLQHRQHSPHSTLAAVHDALSLSPHHALAMVVGRFSDPEWKGRRDPPRPDGRSSSATGSSSRTGASSGPSRSTRLPMPTTRASSRRPTASGCAATTRSSRRAR